MSRTRLRAHNPIAFLHRRGPQGSRRGPEAKAAVGAKRRVACAESMTLTEGRAKAAIDQEQDRFLLSPPQCMNPCHRASVNGSPAKPAIGAFPTLTATSCCSSAWTSSGMISSPFMPAHARTRMTPLPEVAAEALAISCLEKCRRAYFLRMAAFSNFRPTPAAAFLTAAGDPQPKTRGDRWTAADHLPKKNDGTTMMYASETMNWSRRAA